ncbi:Atxe2 family lasso peptide isopeptidase [Rhodanobacter glycinis]|uniref:Dipeptidyl aminopeptidase/acylaminoacyl peptidase n=1 Tax=Rhodanobacter glycinis TaxID=582702 RepID=A0A1I4A0H7_9GAMM|nr:Atxe2 family lasso peptide isopeptidase [Rhodanobacter glycinis]SFK49884.1 Dipeptidyl aminopeptidase/acylaminoacyl peptidase [Rhodanobacter glycinis]
MMSVPFYVITRRILSLGLLLSVFAAVPQAFAVSPRQLVEIADFSSPVVSPDGMYVAFRVSRASIERNTYDTVWYIQRMDGSSPPQRVGDGGFPLRDSAGIPVPATVVWSPDGRWVYYRARLGGRIDVWRASINGAAAERVTGGDADVRGFALSDDGKVLKYSIGPTREDVAAAEQSEYDHGIHVDRSTPLGQPLFRSGYTEGRPTTQRLGLMFNRIDLTADVPDRWKAIDLASGAVRDLAPSERPPKVLEASDLAKRVPHIWKLARDRKSGRIALVTRTGARAGRPRIELAMLPSRDARHLVKCVAEACVGKRISGVQWRPGTDEVIFTVTPYDRGFAQSIYRWNVDTGAAHLVATSSGLFGGEKRWEPGTCGVSSKALACVTANANRPPRLERVDLQTGARQVLFDPNKALAQDLAKIPTQLLRWTDAKGRTFTGQLYSARRSGNTPPPLFITYYWCIGFVRGGAGDEWPLATMAEQGISTLCINSPSFSPDADKRYSMGQSAVESAVQLLASEGRIDRSKVGMGGLSFGSEVTMWTLIHSDVITAASMASPTTSFMYYLLGSNIGKPFLSLLRTNWQLGAPDKTPAQWRKISPTLNLDKIHAPILMQFPEQEYMFALGYAIPLMLSHRADVYVFPNEPHNKFQPRHKLAVYARNLDWFRFWLQGYEDPDPTRAAQYAHWRTMRSSMCQEARNTLCDREHSRADGVPSSRPCTSRTFSGRFCRAAAKALKRRS